jgi:3-isopropylmalate dehydrogenase
MSRQLTVLPGDGIGPEVMSEALKILKQLNDSLKLDISWDVLPFGGTSIDSHGSALSSSTLKSCENSTAILQGSVGGPKWDHLPMEERPESALLKLRSHFKLFANLRPLTLPSSLASLSPLKNSKVKNGFDILCLRELTGGIYFGPKGEKEENGERQVFDTLIYSESEIKRIALLAFQLARGRRKKVTSIDKANVLHSMKFWRETVTNISRDFPEVELEHLYVDNAAMQLMNRPASFDVLLCPNMFGDILSDQGAMCSGSLGMLPSASLGKGDFGLYEPSGGSAPDIAGKNVANPIAQILSLSLCLKHSFKQSEASQLIEEAVRMTLDKGFRTADIYSAKKEERKCSTLEMGSAIRGEIESLLN